MNNNTELYEYLGIDYLLIPEKYREIVYESHQMKIVNCKELLLKLEAAIKDVYDRYSKADETGITRTSKKDKRCIQILLESRRYVMNKMFTESESSFHQFKTINSTLINLSEKLDKKILSLYQSWLDNEEDDWKNDCQVEGAIIAEGWKEMEYDETGSDYNTMLSIIEETTDRNLLEIGFSGDPNKKTDAFYQLSWNAKGGRLFSLGGSHPYGDFTMCAAFDHLFFDSLYSHQDILRIEMFWADATITHQRIVTPQGEYL